MTHKIRFSDAEAVKSAPIVGVLRGVILVGVWVLVALAGLAVWIRLQP